MTADRTNPFQDRGEVQRALGKFCHACQAIPVAGYCNLAGCPKADLRPLLSTNEALARENERLREALEKIGALRADDLYVIHPDMGPTAVALEAKRIARLALKPSHDQTGAKG